MGEMKLQVNEYIKSENIKIYDYIFNNRKEETLVIYETDTEITLEQNLQKILNEVYIMIEEGKIEYKVGNISLVIVVEEGISNRLKMSLENDKLYLKKYIIDNIKNKNLEVELRKKIPCMFTLEDVQIGDFNETSEEIFKKLEKNQLTYELIKKYKLETLKKITVKEMIEEVLIHENKRD